MLLALWLKMEGHIVMTPNSSELASYGAISVGVQQAAVTYLASLGDSLGMSRLRPCVEKDNSSAVDDVRLDSSQVQHLLELRDAYNVVVGRPSNLNNMVIAVLRVAA